jgi:hypothetical protein
LQGLISAASNSEGGTLFMSACNFALGDSATGACPNAIADNSKPTIFDLRMDAAQHPL